jgi:CBS domain-containing protein
MEDIWRGTMIEKKVRDIMSRGIVTGRHDQTLPEIAEIIAAEDVSSIILVDDRDETVGIISSLDIVKAYGEKTPDEIRESVAEDIMTPLVYDVIPQMTLEEVSNIMVIKGIHRVVVLSEEGSRKPVGMLSATDIVREVGKYQGGQNG